MINTSPRIITDASNTAPIVIESAAHGLVDSAYLQVFVWGVLGNTAANGTWFYTVIDANHFSLNDSVGNGAFLSGETMLDGAINSSETSIDVESVAGFPAVPFRIQIGTEIMLVTAIVGTTLTVERGYSETTAASHIDNSPVMQIDLEPAEVTLSNELNLSAAIIYEDSDGTSDDLAISNLIDSVTDKKFIKTSITVGITEEVIPLGEVIEPGWAFFINRDPTNYIDLRVATGGAKFTRLYPGRFAMLPLGPGAQVPYAIANLAACKMDYLIASA